MPGSADGGGGGLLDKLSTLVEKLAELAEKGDELRKSGELTSSDQKVRGAYDLNVRVGVGGAGEEEGGPKIEPVDKAQRGEGQPGEAAVHQVREPFVDVFDEAEGTLIVAQLPGVPCREVVLELRGDILTLDAEHDHLAYHKEILLSRSFSKDQMQTSCRNGIVQIRLRTSP